MATNVVVLGAGLIGRTIVADLAAEPTLHVTVLDASPEALTRLPDSPHVKAQLADLRAPDGLEAAVAAAELAICAVPGFMGFEVLRRVIGAGRDVVDTSFFPEDAFALDALAREKGVTAVVDCGVAPGLCNLLAGRAAAELDSLTRYRCYVGGLPRERRWPYEYGAVFSPGDVIEEYTRPARLREGGRELVRPALSGLEQLDLPGVGTLEAFTTDGLRSLLTTLDAPDMIEKTLRYPGHAELMRVFRESGFFDQQPLELGGARVSPRELTSHLLFAQWRLAEGEADLTVMRVEIGGLRGGAVRSYRFDLLDRYDAATKTTSMARTTGYTCTMAARQLLAGRFTRKGVCPPSSWVAIRHVSTPSWPVSRRAVCTSRRP